MTYFDEDLVPDSEKPHLLVLLLQLFLFVPRLSCAVSPGLSISALDYVASLLSSFFVPTSHLYHPPFCLFSDAGLRRVFTVLYSSLFSDAGLRRVFTVVCSSPFSDAPSVNLLRQKQRWNLITCIYPLFRRPRRQRLSWSYHIVLVKRFCIIPWLATALPFLNLASSLHRVLVYSGHLTFLQPTP